MTEAETKSAPAKAPAPATATATATATKPTSNVRSFQTKSTGFEAPAEVDRDLVMILTWPRCHDSPEEQAFAAVLKAELANLGYTPRVHQEGAFSVSVPHANGKAATTLFSCHIDTVDSKQVSPTLRKNLTYDPSFGLIALDTGSIGNCLGADDGAGIWIMLKMIAAKVPGTYLFHRGEERGGISAKAIASKEGAWLAGFEAAVAFDRHMHTDVIITQGGAECASKKFGDALAKALNGAGDFSYETSTRGVYTDTKEYRKVIPECVNISVGYHDQHGRNESQDYAHLHALMLACCKVNWEALPVDRDPTKPDPAPRWTSGALWDDDWGDAGRKGSALPAKSKGNPPATSTITRSKRAPLTSEDIVGTPLSELRWYCEEEPEQALALIVDLIRENARLKADVGTLESMIDLEG